MSPDGSLNRPGGVSERAPMNPIAPVLRRPLRPTKGLEGRSLAAVRDAPLGGAAQGAARGIARIKWRWARAVAKALSDGAWLNAERAQAYTRILLAITLLGAAGWIALGADGLD